MSVIVSFKGRKMEMPLQGGDTLRDLVNRCEAETGVPSDRIKLLASGESPAGKRKRVPEKKGFFSSMGWPFTGLFEGESSAGDGSSDNGKVNMFGQEDVKGSYIMMKDLNASLIHYGIKSGSKIMMMGDNAPTPTGPRPTATPKPSTPPMRPEQTAIHKLSEIDASLATTIMPLVEEYTNSATAYTLQTAESSNGTHITAKKLKDGHARVSELILQTLLKVDEVLVGENDELRMRRKDAVRRCNALLDRVDAAKESVKAFDSKM
ncbi:hypothetical protein HDU77_009263 [Chytriomyces hyalinus]|nr:hypothetical protein HDU77_009263 [Chytriomyces hyalinus]